MYFSAGLAKPPTETISATMRKNSTTQRWNSVCTRRLHLPCHTGTWLDHPTKVSAALKNVSPHFLFININILNVGADPEYQKQLKNGPINIPNGSLSWPSSSSSLVSYNNLREIR